MRAFILLQRQHPRGGRRMLYLVGLGLGDATDITVRGLEIVKTATRVYLEAYTSILTIGKDELVRSTVENMHEYY